MGNLRTEVQKLRAEIDALRSEVAAMHTAQHCLRMSETVPDTTATVQKLGHDIANAVQENAERFQQELWEHTRQVEREIRTCANDLQQSLQARFAELEQSYHVVNGWRFCPSSTSEPAAQLGTSGDAAILGGDRITLHSQGTIQQVDFGDLKMIDRGIERLW